MGCKIVFCSEFPVILDKAGSRVTRWTRSLETTSICFSVITVNNERGKSEFKKSVGAKFKDGSGLKATGIFLVMVSQDGFENNSPERKS